jgi:hypothetical protein
MPLRLCRLEAKRQKNIHCVRQFIVDEMHFHNSHTLRHNKTLHQTAIQSAVHTFRLGPRSQHVLQCNQYWPGHRNVAWTGPDRHPSHPFPVCLSACPSIGPTTASTNIGAGNHAISFAINKRFGLVDFATADRREIQQ